MTVRIVVEKLIQFPVGFDVHIENGDSAQNLGALFLPVDHLDGALEMKDVGVTDGDFRENESRYENGVGGFFLNGKTGIGNVTDPPLHPFVEKGVDEREDRRR